MSIPTWHFRQDTRLKNGKTTSSKWQSLPILPRAMLQPFLVEKREPLFYIGDHTYLACTDRLTGWLILYHLEPGHATTTKLMSICQQLFETYGAPEELNTYGGQPFTSNTFQEFLWTWFVKHRLSSITYPQSNGRAELAVKTTKRIVKGNIASQGSSDYD